MLIKIIPSNDRKIKMHIFYTILGIYFFIKLNYWKQFEIGFKL